MRNFTFASVTDKNVITDKIVSDTNSIIINGTIADADFIAKCKKAGKSVGIITVEDLLNERLFCPLSHLKTDYQKKMFADLLMAAADLSPENKTMARHLIDAVISFMLECIEATDINVETFRTLLKMSVQHNGNATNGNFLMAQLKSADCSTAVANLEDYELVTDEETRKQIVSMLLEPLYLFKPYSGNGKKKEFNPAMLYAKKNTVIIVRDSAIRHSYVAESFLYSSILSAFMQATDNEKVTGVSLYLDCIDRLYIPDLQYIAPHIQNLGGGLHILTGATPKTISYCYAVYNVAQKKEADKSKSQEKLKEEMAKVQAKAKEAEPRVEEPKQTAPVNVATVEKQQPLPSLFDMKPKEKPTQEEPPKPAFTLKQNVHVNEAPPKTTKVQDVVESATPSVAEPSGNNDAFLKYVNNKAEKENTPQKVSEKPVQKENVNEDTVEQKPANTDVDADNDDAWLLEDV